MKHQHVSRPSTDPLLSGAPRCVRDRCPSAARVVEQRARRARLLLLNGRNGLC
jgi:hypothetical protein